jgi:hypothetical protein
MTKKEIAEFDRTFSATNRNIVKPTDAKRTLCGGRVQLREHYIGDDGQPRTTAAWMVRDLPQCERCAKSASKHGIQV